MRRRPVARELERQAASRPPSRAAAVQLLSGGVAAMLARRGFRVKAARVRLPFPPHLEPARAEDLAGLLCHYGFRLFLRGAIQRAEGFSPSQATRYLAPSVARAFAARLVAQGLLQPLRGGRYRLVVPAPSFGSTLEWFVGRELDRRLGFETAVGLKLRQPGVGGDLDVVATAEGKLIYLELKSSPPKNLAPPEVRAFFERVAAIRPDIALFVVDTALRLGDKVVPLLAEQMAARGRVTTAPVRIVRELWSLTPHVFAVNAKPDLLRNIAQAISLGLAALAPSPP